MTEAELTAALEQLRNPTDAALGALRARVLERVGPRKWHGWQGPVTVAAGLVLGLGIGATRFLSSPLEPIRASLKPAVWLPMGAKREPEMKAVRRRRTKLPRPSEALRITMLTDDPNVVIVWLVDGKS